MLGKGDRDIGYLTEITRANYMNRVFLDFIGPSAIISFRPSAFSRFGRLPFCGIGRLPFLEIGRLPFLENSRLLSHLGLNAIASAVSFASNIT